MSVVLKKILSVMVTLSVTFGAYSLAYANPGCPDCLPEEDGSIFAGGSCENCDKHPKSAAAVRVVDGRNSPDCPDCVDDTVVVAPVIAEAEPSACPQPEFKTKNYVMAQPRYKRGGRNCCDMAPFTLAHVDFNLKNQEGYSPYASHVGNYRFRIFGCRRANKQAILNHGRMIQKNMRFQDVFKKSVGTCYKVVEIPDVCLADENVKLPEYVLTAEITNFFMNVCDEYNWKKLRKSNRRNGSAEMTVTWRLLNLGQTEVLWKGITTGYAELDKGVFEGEVKLTELAFADAAARLESLPGFDNQLKMRLSAEEMQAERAQMVAFDEKFNPGKCVFAKEVEQTCANTVISAPQPVLVAEKQIVRQKLATCPCAVAQPCICNQPVCSCPQVSCPCAQAAPKVEEFVDVKTKTQTVEKKIITTTRVETPQPVCRQVCRPVCPHKKVVKTEQVIETVETSCPTQCFQECKQPKCRKVCTETCVDKQCSTECVEDCGEPKPVEEPKVEIIENPQVKVIEEIEYKPAVEEVGGVEVENKAIAPQIEETGGIEDTHRVYENCIDETGNVISDGSCVVVDDSWVDLDGYDVDVKLCIVDRPPYSELSPENMLSIRSSVVEITNAMGKKGMGLIISDTFVLTSAGLVNKLQNVYDVKTISGEVLKAKAVRINPGKNTALMHLEKAVSYTPLSLNMDLPAIDQEGFITLGLLGNGEAAKNYMDEDGKIYGYRYSENLGTEIIVDTLVQKVAVGSVLIDKLGTVNGISNSAKQTEEGMDLFLPTETALRSVGLSICEKLYDKKSPWEKVVKKPEPVVAPAEPIVEPEVVEEPKVVEKPVTEKVKVETKAPEAMPKESRK